ncbi:MAG TPA: hypothetical protein PK264_09425 [Hyphomicrobiaceae bacterium]|nr:hypothetical protein [Hyphomicrobiaceae bacterium]
MSAAAETDGRDEPDIERLVLASVDDEWRRVAIVIARTIDAARSVGLTVEAGRIAVAIVALAEAGRLMHRGNLRRWRAGEVRRRSAAG